MKCMYLLVALQLAPLASLHAAEDVKPVLAGVADKFLNFNWNRVPLNIHFGKQSEMTDAEIAFVASHSEFVVLEKSHGVGAHGSTEKGVFDTAWRLKQRNPRVRVLFYFNAFVNWPGYDAFATYRSEWTLKSTNGHIVKHPSGTSRPDPSNAEFREWWSEIVGQAVKNGNLDGVFADALPQSRSPALTRMVGAEKQQAVVDGLRQMLALTKRKMGGGKLVLANGIRAGRHLDFLDWEGIDGVMIEHFDAFDARAPENLKADLDSMALAASKGKFVVLKGWPGFTWMDPDAKEPTRQQKLRLARERIRFPLACFLIGAQPGCHFCYSWGYTDSTGGLDTYPEFQRPLGRPKADAVWDGLTATREFAHASVWINLSTKRARIDWKQTP
jgi:hypothetical protein